MPVKAPPRVHYHKRKPPKHFTKVYWPYLPLVISVIIGLVAVNTWRPMIMRRGVLAYATSMSADGLLSSTNEQRTSNGKGALKLNGALNSAAQTKANDMAARNYWSHVSPDGKQPWYFFDQAGYKYLKAGENLAYGFDTSISAVNGWMNSPSHRDNLLDGQFLEVGFGIANAENYQENGPQTIVVAMYGRPAVAGTNAQQPSAQPKAEAAQPSPIKVEEPASPEITSGENFELPQQNISVVEAISAGRAAWSGMAIGVLVGGLITYLAIKHGLAFRRVLVRSERFVFHHPLLDISLISVVALGIMLNQTIGFIR